MRSLPGAVLGVLLASCAVLTPSSTEEGSIERPVSTVTEEGSIERPVSTVNPAIPESEREAPKPKPKTKPPASEVSSCAGLDTGDLKETIRAKLDCITENAK